MSGSDARRRLVLVVADAALGGALGPLLSDGGFDVRVSEPGDDVVALTRALQPDLVVVGEALPRRSGRQVVLSLRASGETFKVPVAGVLSAFVVPRVLDWFRVGSTDLWQFPFTRDVATRAHELVDECERSQVQMGTMKTRVLAWAGRARLTGTATVYEGTPFEGRASFVDGLLRHAQVGSRKGEKALEAFLELEDGPVHFEEGLATPAHGVPQVNGYKPRVLVVEDEDAVRVLLLKQLQALGCVTDSVGDGQEALRMMPGQPWDVVIADLMLPGLDGWGLLRALKADVELREVSVLFLSGHAQAVDTLKVARAGARAYLHKPMRQKELQDTVQLLLRPRATVWNALSRRNSVALDGRLVGTAWLLRTLAELDCQGRLELEDPLGRYEVEVSQGQLVSAVAQQGSMRVVGQYALEAVLASRGEGSFSFCRVDVPDDARWLYEQLDETVAQLRKEEANRLSKALAQPKKLRINEELAQLFAPMATVTQLKVLDAVPEAEDLVALSSLAGVPEHEVEQALSTLLRRGVLNAAGSVG